VIIESNAIPKPKTIWVILKAMLNEPFKKAGFVARVINI
jgi:hypothetical protein